MVSAHDQMAMRCLWIFRFVRRNVAGTNDKRFASVISASATPLAAPAISRHCLPEPTQRWTNLNGPLLACRFFEGPHRVRLSIWHILGIHAISNLNGPSTGFAYCPSNPWRASGKT